MSTEVGNMPHKSGAMQHLGSQRNAGFAKLKKNPYGASSACSTVAEVKKKPSGQPQMLQVNKRPAGSAVALPKKKPG